MKKKSKKPTSLDVAKAAGVSQSTVSMILSNAKYASFSEETRQKVYKACITTGYRGIAHKTETNNEKILMTVCPSCENLDYLKAVKVIQQRCSEYGYGNFTLFSQRDPNTENGIPQMLQTLPVEGVIFLYQPENLWLLSKISDIKPTISVFDRNSVISLDAIELNSQKIGKVIATHLIELGHERIAYVAIDVNNKYMSRVKRLVGIKETYRKNGYDPEECITLCTYSTEGLESSSDLTEYEAGFVLANRIIDKYEVTAFVGNNDMICLGILDALQRRKSKVPQDYSVCGCDNIALSNHKAISLTTVENYTHLRAGEAVDVLIKKMKQHSSDKPWEETPISMVKIEYEPRLVVRASTGPARLKKLF